MSEDSNQLSYVTILEKNIGGHDSGLVRFVSRRILNFLYSILSIILYSIGGIGMRSFMRGGDSAVIGVNSGGIIAPINGAITSAVLVGF